MTARLAITRSKYILRICLVHSPDRFMMRQIPVLLAQAAETAACAKGFRPTHRR
jgi:hypothetical protein